MTDIAADTLHKLACAERIFACEAAKARGLVFFASALEYRREAQAFARPCDRRGARILMGYLACKAIRQARLAGMAPATLYRPIS